MNAPYLNEGWLDVPTLAKYGCWLNVIIGARQVGKTYGTMLKLLEEGSEFIYMRRSAAELELATMDASLNPFNAMESEGYHIGIFKKGKTFVFGEYRMEEDKMQLENKRGICLALSQVASIRGFNGSAYKDVMFDEFIPEKTVVKRKLEGEAFLNAYVTINGNRELKGEPPLRCWLLANANDLASPILAALNLTDTVVDMQRGGDELRIMDGVLLCIPNSRGVIDKRKETALMRHLNKDAKFAKMALDNKFAYDSDSLIRPKSVKGWRCICQIGDYFLYDNGNSLYLTRTRGNTRRVYTEDKKVLAGAELAPCVELYYRQKLSFDSASALLFFKDFLDIME